VGEAFYREIFEKVGKGQEHRGGRGNVVESE
jgi:hypothetical protein